MGVVLVIVLEPRTQLLHYRVRIFQLVHRDVISLEGLHEGLGHAVRLRAMIRGRADLKAHEAGKADRVVGSIRRAVVRESFDHVRNLVDETKAVLDGKGHRVRSLRVGCFLPKEHHSKEEHMTAEGIY